MKRFFPVLTALTLLLVCLFLLPTKAQAAIVARGTCGDNVAWKLDDTGTLTISGTSVMKNYDVWKSNGKMPWYSYGPNIKQINIQEGVTSIGNYAFYDCRNLTSIEIPNSITYIGDYAFHGCTSLASVTIPESVTSMGRYVFEYCNSLTSIQVDTKNPNYSSDAVGVMFNKDKSILIKAPGLISGRYIIPNGVAHIEDSAFYYTCGNLSEIVIPNSVTSIGNSAFLYCESIKNVIFCGTEDQWFSISIGVGNEWISIRPKYHHFENSICTFCAVVCTHTYDNNCDSSCNVCGGIRTVTHQYSSSWSSDTVSHWYSCSICGKKTDQAVHTPGAVATETTAQTCTTCGYVIQAALGHTHKFGTGWDSDASGHWHSCACGSQDGYAAHTPGPDATATTDQTCTVCGKVLQSATGAAPTEPPTEGPTEPPTEPTTEPTTEPSTNAPTEPTNPSNSDDGSDSSVIIVAVVAALAGAGIAGGAAAGIILWKKKH